ncbi:MAG: hypothetical protein M1826_000489 [Phylliscum demangeonii]|nr:MAG: hypothetical protein M1826_000489 [Phylliscum demangeonii]
MPRSPALQAAFQRIQESIQTSLDDGLDNIHDCGRAATRLLEVLARKPSHGLPPAGQPDAQIIGRLDDLIRLSHDKLHAYPFQDVPTCWRRLYSDASILKAMHEGSTEPLDLAIIMAGAPLRRALIDAIFAVLEDEEKEESDDNNNDDEEERGAKRRKVEFSSVALQPATVTHPILRTARLANYTTPMVITDSIAHWPALTRWAAPSYLLRKTLGGRRLVPVEIGRSYTDEGWGQAIVPFGQFVRDHILADRVGYLAQHDLFAQMPSLRNDVCIPDCCFTKPPPTTKTATATAAAAGDDDGDDEDEDGDGGAQDDFPLLNAWFGPAGTVSPLHTDPYDNILCQVVGSKYVRLYAPTETAKLYARGLEENGVDMGNTSQVDVEAASSSSSFPLFAHARYVDAVLAPAECLYIPGRWWHYVRSLTVSFSVSFWF